MVKHKQRWIKKAYGWLCRYQGAPANANEEKNMRQWAWLLGNCDCNYFEDGYTPREAVEDELSYA